MRDNWEGHKWRQHVVGGPRKLRDRGSTLLLNRGLARESRYRVITHSCGKTFLADTNCCHSQIFFVCRSKCFCRVRGTQTMETMHSLHSGCAEGRHLAESSSWMEQRVCNMLVNVGDCTDISCTWETYSTYSTSQMHQLSRTFFPPLYMFPPID